MPYIDIKITQKLKDDDKAVLKKRLGESISIIKGKEEKVLMIGIDDGYTIYLAGALKENAAYIDLKILHEAKQQDKINIIKEFSKIFEEIFNIPKEDLYITISEFDNWGSDGVLI